MFACALALRDESIEGNIPGRKFLKALLGMGIAGFPAGSAEAAGRSACCDQCWDGIDGAGAPGNDVADAIGTKEGAGLRASDDTK